MTKSDGITFYDSAIPADIPSRDYAALYRDGDYGAAGQAAAHLFAHVRWITVADNYQQCSIIDYEAGNPSFDPGVLQSYLAGRAKRKRIARVYCNLNDIASALSEIGDLPNTWWLAAWSGPEGQPGYRWAAPELAAFIAANYGVSIPVDRLWGCQYLPSQDYDTSVLYRAW
jgi:hypothetical protein